MLLLALISVRSWGSGDSLLASGDTFPSTELNPEKWIPSTLRLWNTAFTAGGDLHYGSHYFLLSVLDWVPRHLGVSAAVVQRLEFFLVLVGIMFAFFALPREMGITSRVFPRLLGTVAYAFSLALLSQWLDMLVYVWFLLAALIPVLYSRILRSVGIVLVARLAVLAIAVQLLAYLFANPPETVLVVVQISVSCLYLFFLSVDKKTAVIRSMVAFLLSVLCSLWWIIPAYITTFDPSLRIDATTDVASWAWVHANASVLNAWRFTAEWSWPYKEYFPWNTYYQPSWVQVVQLWPFVVVGLAMLSARRAMSIKKSGDWLWAIGAITSVYLIKGLHPPLTSTNSWIYQHIPGFFLFRESASKFSESLDFFTAILLVVVLDRLLRVARNFRFARYGGAGVALFVVGMLGLPMFTGAVAEAAPSRIAPVQITIPPYWHQMADYINDLPGDAGIALLPNDDFYAMKYTWGYYGTDALAQELINRSVLYLNDSPQGYISAASGQETLNEQLVKDIKLGMADGMASLLGAEGVGYILLRQDVSPDVAQRDIVSPQVLATLLSRSPGIVWIKAIGDLSLYEIAPGLVRSRMYAAPIAQTNVQAQPSASAIDEANAANRTVVSATASVSRVFGQTVNAAGTDSLGPALTVRTDMLDRDRDGYTVRIQPRNDPSLLVLNQNYNADWIAMMVQTPSNAARVGNLQHVVVNGFANGWWIAPSDRPMVVRVFFRPQRVADIGEAVSGTLLSAAFIWILMYSAITWSRYLPSFLMRRWKIGRKTDLGCRP